MALLRDIYNTAMGRPSFNSQPNLNRFNTPLNKSFPGMQKPLNPKPQSTGPKPIDFRNGVYKDPSRHDSNFRYRVSQQVNLSRYEARNTVSRIMYESRGGEGIGKQEFIDGLNSAVSRGELKQHEADAARTQFHAW